MNSLRIARICHEVNRAYCESLGDLSQPTWEAAPEWQRDSALNGVIAHISNPLMTPEDSHNAWLADKRARGWKYGPDKNADLKEHPCMVAYSDLPQAQRSKDYIFRAIVHVLMYDASVHES